MTRFLDTYDIRVMLQRTGVTEAIRGIASYIRADYLRWLEFDKSPRVANHSPEGVIELMPVSDNDLYGFKYVNGHPKNTRYNMMTVMSFGVLASVDNGLPLLLSEFTIMTALRTAATSALAARAMARPDARTMALIGNGAQGEFQALAFHDMLGIEEIRLFDTDPAATDKLLRNLAGVAGLRLVRCESAQQAVRAADIVSTVTADKRNATILTPDMVEPGMHINAVGGDCPGKTELHRTVLENARVMVEFEPQTRVEGDIQQLPADSPIVHFWQVLAGDVAGREHAKQVTVFDSVGFALEDFSTLRYLNDVANAAQIGMPIELVAQPEDCKDLFGLVALPTPAVPAAGPKPARGLSQTV
jgi:ornithine cyclodeaminase